MASIEMVSVDPSSVNDETTALRGVSTLHGVLADRAQRLGGCIAYTFEGGRDNATITFSHLDLRARAIAGQLQKVAKRGDRVLLLFPAGLEFIEAFLGCLYAGMRAVPTTYPKPRRPMPRLKSIADDCSPVVSLTDSETLATIDESVRASKLPEMIWIATNSLDDSLAAQFVPQVIEPDEIAFLQYTSGSTSEPKGVMVSHVNLLHNLEMIRQGFGLQFASESRVGEQGVFWLPAYHDMGLIGGVLESLYVGGHSVLMSPAAFLQRPLGWLETMSRYQAAVSGAPNFAYELCISRSTDAQRRALDLSHWRVAFCGAEPIRAETFQKFSSAFASSGLRDDVFYPCYGLAEGTLLAAGPRGPGRLSTVRVSRQALEQNQVEYRDDESACELVTCGQPLLNQQIAIVKPDTRVESSPRQVGEIWVKGKSVAQGYWNRHQESRETFAASLAETGDGPYLRTGDLGFLHEGHLVVAGRLKDVIIIRGRNHYPQDIEQTIADSHEALRPDAGAVFAVQHQGQERLVAIHEVDRQYRKADFDEIIRTIRASVAKEHELEVPVVVLIRHMSLPRTTSGKPQRHLCRQQYDAGELTVLAQWTRSERQADSHGTVSSTAVLSEPVASSNPPMTPEEVDRLAERIESWLLTWLIDRAAIPPEEVHASKPFAEYGLDSLTAVELSQELEDWVGVEVVPTVAWNYPTPTALSVYLARQSAGIQDDQDAVDATMASENEFNQLLAEIESMSEDVARKLLND